MASRFKLLRVTPAAESILTGQQDSRSVKSGDEQSSYSLDQARLTPIQEGNPIAVRLPLKISVLIAC